MACHIEDHRASLEVPRSSQKHPYGEQTAGSLSRAIVKDQSLAVATW
jgi:hypothetical protein